MAFDTEKGAGVTGSQSPDYSEHGRRKSAEAVINHDQEREVDFMTRNGLNAQSFHRRKSCEDTPMARTKLTLRRQGWY